MKSDLYHVMHIHLAVRNVKLVVSLVQVFDFNLFLANYMIGCGTLWSLDGLWKLVYPICMHTESKEVAGFSGQLSYVDTCPNQPLPRKAFCDAHCSEATLNGIPTDLKEYISSCKKKGMYMYMINL